MTVLCGDCKKAFQAPKKRPPEVSCPNCGSNKQLVVLER